MNQQSLSHKPTLVFLHGWGLNRAVWPQALHDAVSDWPTLWLDLPGFGERAASATPAELASWTDLLQSDIPDGSILLGWSLGGMVATDLALRYPHKVSALCLIASSPCFLAHDGWPGMKAAVMSQFAAALRDDTALTVDRFLAIQAMGSATARHDIKLLRDAVASLPPPELAALQGGLAILERADLRAKLNELQMPVFGCYGRLDTLVPSAVLEPLQQLLPQAQLSLFAKASHAPFISHPTEFADWLVTHLAAFVAANCKDLRSQP